MINILNSKRLKFLISLVIIIQCFLFLQMSFFFIDNMYIKKLSSEPRDGLILTIKSVPKDRINNTSEFMREFAIKNGVVYIRKDYKLNEKGNVIGIIFGVEGDISKNKTALNINYLDQNIINYNKLKKLLDNTDTNSTIGVDKSSFYEIISIPTFKYGMNIVYKQLNTLISETGTINGEYRIIGLDKTKEKSFIDGLSEASGVDKKIFFDGLSGNKIDNSFKRNLIVGLFIIHSIILLTLLSVITIKYLKNLGNLILLGWSKFNFVSRLYHPIINMGIISIPLLVFCGMYLSNFKFNSIVFYSTLATLGIINLIIIMLLCCIASIFVFIISPINAIKERIPKKLYLAIACFIYIFLNISSLAISIYIDGPYREIQNNVNIVKQWEKVKDYKILSQIDVGNDQSSFNHQSNELNNDLYNWYSSISDNEYAYLINSTYISKELLDIYKKEKVYKFVPEEAFWKYIVSPTYLNKIGIEVKQDIIKKAKEGVRVYLIPDTKSKKEEDLLKKMIIEADTRSLRASDIQTPFYKNKEFEFILYHPVKKVFSWSTKNLQSTMISNPVILINTPNNMIYKESESLIALGLENSYIKLDKQFSKKYLDENYLRKYNLDDNNIRFDNIKIFVDGVQKQLWTTINLFLGVLIAIAFISILLLIIILMIFQSSNKERITVKKFLGYSNLQIYKIPVLFIFVITFIDILTTIIFKSKIGILCMSILSLLQYIAFYKMMISNQTKKIVLFLKS